MCGQKIGGVIPFGGGLALYDSTGALVGGIKATAFLGNKKLTLFSLGLGR